MAEQIFVLKRGPCQKELSSPYNLQLAVEVVQKDFTQGWQQQQLAREEAVFNSCNLLHKNASQLPISSSRSKTLVENLIF